MIDIDKHTDYIKKYSKTAADACIIDPALYQRYAVKRGLRDISGKGVLAGLTEIAEIRAYIISEDEMVPCQGKLFYRGMNIKHITNGFLSDNRFGFEEICYLLLFGSLPNKTQLSEFCDVLGDFRVMKHGFVRDIIMKSPSKDIMNSMARSVLALYSLDDNPDDTSPENVLRQCLELIARFPMCAVYGYQAHRHYHLNESFYIHNPVKGYSTAQNILHMLRPDSTFTDYEAKMLDLALVLHAEHGGGNNSTFTTHVVTSSGTDTYATMAAALGSLKGPKHGGANIKVVKMMQDLKENVHDWTDDDEITAYLEKVLRKEAFDKMGLIYGMGHAVYSLSDPRSEIFKKHIQKLAEEKGRMDEFALYQKVERLAPETIARERKMYKGISANVDFYSGFVYSMLDLPHELYTPIFAVARVAGWSAHRIEEIVNGSKIVRPAYKSIAPLREYVELKDRK
ncbi:MAG: citrate/2-methylcitrate synthase [Christensenellaceae bacterium]|nr:citrate/2-methylcitrate synthase [Christensenellaceae bacterium]